uniref:uncharacterized protein n=1 Tax=Myxine glutinosa TaxID=7769 RepID=UPI0035901EDF
MAILSYKMPSNHYVSNGYNSLMFPQNSSVAACYHELLQLHFGEVRVQLKLRACNALFAALEHTQEAVQIASSEHVIQYVNPALERLSGFSRSELLGRSAADLDSVTPGSSRGETVQDDLLEKINSCIQHGKEWQGILFGHRKAGDWVPQQVRIAPVTGTGRGLCVVIRRVKTIVPLASCNPLGKGLGEVEKNDRSVERESDEDCDGASAKQRREGGAMNFSEGGVLSGEQGKEPVSLCSSVDSQECGKSYVNPALERLSGFSRSELLGRSAADLDSVTPGSSRGETVQDDLLEKINSCIQHGKEWQGILFGHRKAGDWVPQQVRIAPVTGTGRNGRQYVCLKRASFQNNKQADKLKEEDDGQPSDGYQHRYKDRRKGSLDIRSMTSRGSDGRIPCDCLPSVIHSSGHFLRSVWFVL